MCYGVTEQGLFSCNNASLLANKKLREQELNRIKKINIITTGTPNTTTTTNTTDDEEDISSILPSQENTPTNNNDNVNKGPCCCSDTKTIHITAKNGTSEYALNRLKHGITSHTQNSHNVSSVSLVNNSLYSLPIEIYKLQCLTRINISRNAFSFFPIVICTLVNIKSINISDNYIPKIPKEIKNLTNLEYFHCNENRIQEIPESLCCCTNLKGLYMGSFSGGNLLKTLPESIRKLQNLEELDCSYNRITHLPSSIGDLKSLRILNLERNEIHHLPCTVGKLSNIGTINAQHNQLVSLPESLSACRNLRMLNVTFNLLKHIPGELCWLASHAIVLLGGNPLHSNSIAIRNRNFESLNDLLSDAIIGVGINHHHNNNNISNENHNNHNNTSNNNNNNNNNIVNGEDGHLIAVRLPAVERIRRPSIHAYNQQQELEEQQQLETNHYIVHKLLRIHAKRVKTLRKKQARQQKIQAKLEKKTRKRKHMMNNNNGAFNNSYSEMEMDDIEEEDFGMNDDIYNDDDNEEEFDSDEEQEENYEQKNIIESPYFQHVSDIFNGSFEYTVLPARVHTHTNTVMVVDNEDDFTFSDSLPTPPLIPIASQQQSYRINAIEKGQKQCLNKIPSLRELSGTVVLRSLATAAKDFPVCSELWCKFAQSVVKVLNADQHREYIPADVVSFLETANGCSGCRLPCFHVSWKKVKTESFGHPNVSNLHRLCAFCYSSISSVQPQSQPQL
eukprot:Pgem_evm1s2112